MRKLFLLFFSFLLTSVSLMAQKTDDTSAMASNGKIYVVMAVCLTILAGIFIYLVRIDRKISGLEKKND